jgi:hypothetical protein
MAWAQRSGVLYRRLRLEAQGRGEQFMGYALATARLRRAITSVGTEPGRIAPFAASAIIAPLQRGQQRKSAISTSLEHCPGISPLTKVASSGK